MKSKGKIRYHNVGEMGALAKRLLNAGKEEANRKNNDQIRQLMRVVYLLVQASGGKVVIPKRLLEQFNPTHAMITSYTDVASGDFVYEVQDNREAGDVQAD